MKIRRFIMEDWLSSYKDTCRFNLGESGMPDMSVGELLEKCGETPDSLAGIVLKDHDTRGTDRLREAITASYTNTNTNSVAFDNVTVTTGTSEALFILFSLFMENRSSVVAPKPSFQALYEIPKALGAEMRYYHLDYESGFTPNPDEVCSLIDDSTGLVVINTPHNPSGVIIPEDAAEAIINKAAFHGVTVLADEHYRYLPLDGIRPLQTLARPYENVIATGSVTKCFGLIGLRVGWIAASESLISEIRDFRDYLTHTLSPVSDYLAALALENAQVIIDPALAVLHDNVSALSKMVTDTPGISCVKPEGGVVAFPRFDYTISSNEFAEKLIKEHSVFVLPGSSFEVDNHFRINLGQDHALFCKALDHIHDLCLKL